MTDSRAPEKQRAAEEKDRLMGELIGLSRAVCGNIDEDRFAPGTDTHRIVLRGLALAAEEFKAGQADQAAGLSAQATEEKWKVVPSCRYCAAPCGRVAAFDLAELREDEPDIRSLKGEILANVKKAAAPALSALDHGVLEEAVCQGFYQALYAVGIFFTREKLGPALKKSEALLKACREAEKKGLQKARDERFMREAIRQAKKAEAIGETPIGCVIVRDGQIISRGYNRRTAERDVLAHAEIIAIHRACRKLGDWRLSDCTLYVTLEPCPMCAGAMVQSRLGRCVIGSMSDKSGCAGSVIDLLGEKKFNHQVTVESGVLAGECSELLSRFFERMRRKES